MSETGESYEEVLHDMALHAMNGPIDSQLDRTVDGLFQKFREKDADKTNPKSTWQMDRLLNHLHSEVSEIWDALRRNKPRQQVIEEVSDALNLIVIVAVRLGITAEELVNTSHAKFDAVAQREAQGIRH